MEKKDFQIFQDPTYWLGHHKRLKISADVLMDKMIEDELNRAMPPQEFHERNLALFESYMLLMALSVENLVKAHAIKEYMRINPGHIFENLQEIKQLAWGGKKHGHDLIKILEFIGFEIHSAERDLLNRLQGFVIWAGRYPIPQNQEVLEDSIENNKRKLKASDKEVLYHLEVRLEKKYGR